jgi:hypothetical protein
MGVNNGGSRHVTTPISLADDAVGVKVNFDANLPDPASTYDFYYRTAVSNDNILDKPWVRYPVNPEITGNRNSYVNQEILIGGQNGSLDPFNMFQSKIVFTSSNMAVSPSIRSLMTKFLAT